MPKHSMTLNVKEKSRNLVQINIHSSWCSQN